jgi:hypothetical protein
VFNFLDINIARDLKLSEYITLKFILLCTTFSNRQHIAIKNEILKKLIPSTIENYMLKIKDDYVKTNTLAYLLENNLIPNQIQYLKKYLPTLLAHHSFYSAIEKVCDRTWNDELAAFFLSCFINQQWNSVSAQMFDELTDLFAKKLTKEQLTSFESTRKQPVNILIERIYKIWLEYNSVIYKNP